MLDDGLLTEERRALLLLLTSVALSDGRLSDPEVRFVQRLALPLGIEVGELLGTIDEISIDAVCVQLAARPQAARLAVIELLRLAHVDDVYAHVEQRTIAGLAGRLGVPPETVEAMEDWVHREWEHLARGRRLVESG